MRRVEARTDHRRRGQHDRRLIERRANLFQTIELQDEIASLKAQIAGIVVTAPRPGLHVVERASPSALGKG